MLTEETFAQVLPEWAPITETLWKALALYGDLSGKKSVTAKVTEDGVGVEIFTVGDPHDGIPRLYLGTKGSGAGFVVSVPWSLPCACKFYLYHISLYLDEGDFPEDLAAQMVTGYFGITKRSIIKRYKEHEDKAWSGQGHALHTAWGAAVNFNWTGAILLSLAGGSDTLPDIYKMEEKYVDAHTLLPKGLNVIPGGYAGIRMLHELRLTNNRKLSPDQRDAILEKMERTAGTRKSPVPHYVRGHLRRLDEDRTTWVRAYFKGLNRAAA